MGAVAGGHAYAYMMIDLQGLAHAGFGAKWCSRGLDFGLQGSARALLTAAWVVWLSAWLDGLMTLMKPGTGRFISFYLCSFHF